MMSAIKSEFRKIISVRSTYGVLLFTLLILGIFAFYVEGIKAGESVNSPAKLYNDIVSATSATVVFASLVGALLVTHEYRYNTIVYSLVSSKSRLRVLLSKIFVISVFAVVFSLVVGVLAPLFTYIGISIKGLDLVHQVIPYGDLIWRVVFTSWAYSMIALLFAVLIRNQVGTLAAVFLFQGTVEPLLSLVLKTNAAYLPYNALNSVLMNQGARFSPGDSAMIFMGYMIAGWAVAMYLFVRRDAN